jgi:hypothetical protein
MFVRFTSQGGIAYNLSLFCSIVLPDSFGTSEHSLILFGVNTVVTLYLRLLNTQIFIQSVVVKFSFAFWQTVANCFSYLLCFTLSAHLLVLMGVDHVHTFNSRSKNFDFSFMEKILPFICMASAYNMMPCPAIVRYLYGCIFRQPPLHDSRSVFCSRHIWLWPFSVIV